MKLSGLTAAQRAALLERGAQTDPAVIATAHALVGRVRRDGDAALLEMAREFDRVRLAQLEVPMAECRRALQALPAELRRALEEARDAIEAFHRWQLRPDQAIELRRGVRLERRSEPLARVGVYAPGGRAAYPSSVLMGALPARVAGVREVVLCSPPGPAGLPSAPVLAAAALAQVDRVFAIGGAGAIAALAYGTTSVPRVDRIVGPGNAWVAAAKQIVSRVVGIDSPAGPSELLIIADETADPQLVFLELAAQAEHDPDARVVLLSTSPALLERLEGRLDARQATLLLTATLDEAVAFAADYAPEHLSLMTAEPRALLPAIRNAGTVFLGSNSSVAFGDYSTGANHVLPTAGQARIYAGLSVDDFRRSFTVQEVSARAAAALARSTQTLACAEGLPAHAAAAAARADASGPPARPVLRDVYRDLALYDPKRVPTAIDLSDNTNLFGVAPAARRLLASLADAQVTRYPSVFASRLKQALADWYGVAPDNVTTGCGSDDLIDSALRAFCERGERVAFHEPTFGMIEVFARINALTPVPLASLAPVDARVTYLCNPNNPTGSAYACEQIERISEQAAGVVLLDEAYAEFADVDYRCTAARSERLISLGTMSKAFGLAGLRIGFAIGPADLIAEIEKSRGPYKVSQVAEAAAVAVLSEDRDWVRDVVAQTRVNRALLQQSLTEIGYAPLPSSANFLCVPLKPGQGAAEVAASLQKRGIGIRPFAQLRGLGDCIRVTIGPWPLLERFLKEFEAL